MPSKILRSFISSSFSIVPILIIVTVLSLTGLTPFPDNSCYLLLWISGVILILGLGLFSIGSESSLSKVGEHMGSSLSKQKKIVLVVIISFLLGSLVTCAEPSIAILASQTPIPTFLFVLFVSVGVGLFTVIGIIRVIKHKDLNLWLLAFYGLLFALCIIVEQTGSFPMIFDAGGATTGSATVPFLLSLGASVAVVRGGKKSQDDTFGLIAIASIGPVLSLIIMFIFSRENLPGYEYIPSNLTEGTILDKFLNALLPNNGPNGVLFEVAISISPILFVFLIYQFIFIRLPKSEILRILVGFIYAYLGLVLFLTGTKAAMMPIGQEIGIKLGGLNNGVIIIISFVIGMVTILCEPAIHVLTKQIEKISDGSISNKAVLATLSVGVGIAIGLCAIRTIFNFSIMFYLVPGYIIALLMSFFSPKLFTAMAFDSGGVASGPMTSSFVLSMIIGLTITLEKVNPLVKQDVNGVLSRAFGVIGMVAMTPLIAIQALGIYTKFKDKIHIRLFKKTVFSNDDGQIIHF